MKLVFFLLLSSLYLSLAQVEIPLIEKVYVSHDKPVYAPGETIWAKVFHVDGMHHLPFDAHPIIHIHLISPEGEYLTKYQLKISNGTSAFEIDLPRTLLPGAYTLRAFTQYQQNFETDYYFEKKISIVDVIENLDDTSLSTTYLADIQFYPEGGYLVNGLKSKIAFKLTNLQGRATEGSGAIYDDLDELIVNIKTLHKGLGFFSLTPMSGKTYYAKLIVNNQDVITELPAALQNGYTMNAINHAEDRVILQIKTNIENGLNKARLIAHVRGNILLNQEINSEESSFEIALAKDQLPSGILHWTLFDPSDRPVAERLTYVENPKEKILVDVAWSADNYQKRQRADFNILLSEQDQEIKAIASATVYNQDLFPINDDETNIKNYLLLQSDIPSHIEGINTYFKANSRTTRVLRDLLMLTQGWRRFKWLASDKVQSKPILYPTQEKQTIVGKITRKDKDEPLRADVFLSILDGQQFGATEMTTEEDGIFFFNDLEINDTTDLLIQASEYDENKKNRKLKEGENKVIGDRNVDIQLLDPYEKEANLSPALLSYEWPNPIVVNDYIEERKQIKKIDSLFHSEWSLELDEITISASRLREKLEDRKRSLKDKYNERGIPFFPSTNTLFMEDIFKNRVDYVDIYEVIRGRIPGAEIRGNGNEKVIQIRGINSINNNATAAIYLDGSPISALTASTINPLTVYSIDVVKSLSSTAVYGEQGAGGIVNIITRDPGDPMWQRINEIKKYNGVINMKYPGYYHSRDFFIPDYSSRTVDNQMPDYRPTIYWNASLDIENGAAKGQFYTGDRAGRFVLKIEGITTTGIPFVHYSNMSVGSE
jgi:hypothetical protein